MHPSRYRQLCALLIALVFAENSSFLLATPPEGNPAEELLAANVIRVSLSDREPSDPEWEKLAKTFADLVARYPQNSSIRLSHGAMLWDRGARNQAVAEWKTAVELDPKNSAALHQLGEACLSAGRPVEAVRYLERASAAQPDSAQFRFDVATMLYIFRHQISAEGGVSADALISRSIEQHAAAVRLEPNNQEFARAYAEMFNVLPGPDWERAMAAWQHVLEIAEKPDFALIHLARISLKSGKTRQGLEFLNRVKDPAFERARAHLQSQLERAGDALP